MDFPAHDRPDGHHDRRRQQTTQQALDISAEFSVEPTTAPDDASRIRASATSSSRSPTSSSSTRPRRQPLNRQIFFVTQGGYDTHQDQLADQQTSSHPLPGARGLLRLDGGARPRSDQVTTFTLSDFGRTLQESGDTGGVGTDHGWGPTSSSWATASRRQLLRNAQRPDRIDLPGDEVSAAPTTRPTARNGRGRWIPTTAVGPVRRHAREVVRRPGGRSLDELLPAHRQLREGKLRLSSAPARAARAAARAAPTTSRSSA